MKEHGSRISLTYPQLDLEPGPMTMHERTWVIFSFSWEFIDSLSWKDFIRPLSSLRKWEIKLTDWSCSSISWNLLVHDDRTPRKHIQGLFFFLGSWMEIGGNLQHPLNYDMPINFPEW